MKATQWQQELVKPVVQLTPSSNICNTSKLAISSVEASGGCAEKKAQEGSVVRPPREQPLPCPRCNSSNTKFCYYNNYSLTQPRYFCKGCRRYWTEGGSLRNIPVGGCSRKNKRSPSSSANLPGVGSKKPYVLSPLQSPNLMIHPPERPIQSLNLLTFPAHHHQDYDRSISADDLVQMSNAISFQTTATPNDKSHQSALELLTGRMSTSAGGGLGFGGGFTTNSFMHISDPDSVYASARISDIMQDFKSPTLDFSLDYGLGTRQSNSGSVGMISHNDPISTSGGGGDGRDLVSPFDNVKNQQHHYEQQAASQNRGHGVSTGYWTDQMLGDAWQPVYLVIIIKINTFSNGSVSHAYN